jgi:hypothetical protein
MLALLGRSEFDQGGRRHRRDRRRLSPLTSGRQLDFDPPDRDHVMALQIWGSHRFIAGTFKWLTLAPFACILSAFFSKPDMTAVLRRTFTPTLHLNREFLALIVAVLGTTISPYMFL